MVPVRLNAVQVMGTFTDSKAAKQANCEQQQDHNKL
jgi:hypothetical protein